MAILTQDNKASSTLTQENRTAVGSLTQDSKTVFYGQGKIRGAFLHPIFLTSSSNPNLFIQELRTN